jgi:hypothetical protein
MAAFTGSESLLNELTGFSDHIAAARAGLQEAVLPGPWACSEQFKLNMKAIKHQAKCASDTCTRIGMVSVLSSFYISA